MCIRDRGKTEDAIHGWSQAIASNPTFAHAYNNRAAAYVKTLKYEDGFKDYRKAIELEPTFARAHDNFAWALATCSDDQLRDAVAATKHADAACKLTQHNNWKYLSTLAAANAEADKFDAAVRWIGKAIELAPETQTESLNSLKEMYEAGQKLGN